MNQIVEDSVERFFAEIPAYPASQDPDLRADVVVHTWAVYEEVLASIREHRPAGVSDFRITPEQATNRVRQGIGLSDFLRAFRIGQVTLWEAIVVASSEEAASWEVAVGAATHLMQVIEVGSSVAAAAYLRAQQLELAEGDRVRRDLVEDLLAGRGIQAEPKRVLARECGLEGSASVLVVVAAPSKALRTGQSLRDVLSTVRSSLDADQRGLAIVRQDQILAVIPTTGDGTAVLRGLERVCQSASRIGIDLVVGASTVHPDISKVPEAYREAVIARESLGGSPGVKALSMLSVVEYMVLRDDTTVRRLIRPELRQFIEDDLANGGVLVQTLKAYAAHDLNAKVAAEKLHVHVNTAYYRLERIAERTGCDLRSFADLEELLIAVRLMSGTRGVAPT
ncbi:PucR family transcriptional regulator [Nocardioides albidus]|uniref:PucR family transcriptional regulator n=2 Tax=Nocardioides albidus TaxID=1517589 RepID=A0A5C4VPK0_9ACTN|nr:PucR family transcriptional regulator [Nocardioides albidus]